jgi:hypothetical protein
MSDGFLLDTNVISELTRSRTEPKIHQWVAVQEFETLFISVVSLGEMEKGFTTMGDLPNPTGDLARTAVGGIVSRSSLACHPSHRKTLGSV